MKLALKDIFSRSLKFVFVVLRNMNIIETKILVIVQVANSWKDCPLMNLTSWRM
jgi:hypothetical protein